MIHNPPTNPVTAMLLSGARGPSLRAVVRDGIAAAAVLLAARIGLVWFSLRDYVAAVGLMHGVETAFGLAFTLAVVGGPPLIALVSALPAAGGLDPLVRVTPVDWATIISGYQRAGLYRLRIPLIGLAALLPAALLTLGVFHFELATCLRGTVLGTVPPGFYLHEGLHTVVLAPTLVTPLMLVPLAVAHTHTLTRSVVRFALKNEQASAMVVVLFALVIHTALLAVWILAWGMLQA
ncbi:MAG: hypothetical protein GYB64_08045, partial [Chloroflexi bacterium]|nr:hypothetical protein [Chloroflexota bacterium]